MSITSLATLTAALSGAHGMTPSVRPSRKDRMVFASARMLSTLLDSFGAGGRLMTASFENRSACVLGERKGGKGRSVEDAASYRSRAMRDTREELFKARETPSIRQEARYSTLTLASFREGQCGS
jgi:hypothetical protein